MKHKWFWFTVVVVLIAIGILACVGLPSVARSWGNLFSQQKPVVEKIVKETVIVEKPIEKKIVVTATPCTIPDLTGLDTDSAIREMDSWFEKTGYQYGDAFAPGDPLPPNSVFWTNWGKNTAVPKCVRRIVTEGNWGVFYTTQALDATSNGRFAVCDP